jgi:hypothetical protein
MVFVKRFWYGKNNPSHPFQDVLTTIEGYYTGDGGSSPAFFLQ